jgi:hypothetical protein
MPAVDCARVWQLNAMSLDIPGEDGEGPAIYDLQTDFPWMYEPNAPAADLLERVLKVRDLRELVRGSAERLMRVCVGLSAEGRCDPEEQALQMICMLRIALLDRNNDGAPHTGRHLTRMFLPVTLFVHSASALPVCLYEMKHRRTGGICKLVGRLKGVLVLGTMVHLSENQINGARLHAAWHGRACGPSPLRGCQACRLLAACARLQAAAGRRRSALRWRRCWRSSRRCRRARAPCPS